MLVTIPHGDIIQEAISIVLRGKQVCIKGHGCRYKVKVLAVFGLDCWTRQEKGNLKE